MSSTERQKGKWRPPSQSKLTPIVFNKELTHLDLEASKCSLDIVQQKYDSNKCI